MNLFEMFKEETKEFEDEQKALTLKKGQESKEKSKVESDTKVSKNKEKTKTKPHDPDKAIIEEIKKYPTIVLKAYGNEIMHIEGESEVQAIKLNELSDKLINEFAYQEFSAGISWHVVPNSDKTIAYLVATGKFYSKG